MALIGLHAQIENEAPPCPLPAVGRQAFQEDMGVSLGRVRGGSMGAGGKWEWEGAEPLREY